MSDDAETPTWSLQDDKPVKVTMELPAEVHRDLKAYAEALKHEAGHSVGETKFIAPMLKRFMATDRAFAKLRRAIAQDKQK
jgi:hypothetical protein